MKRQRKKDAASAQLSFCFSGTELLDYRTGSVSPDQRSRIYHHLNVLKCPRCRELYLSAREMNTAGPRPEKNTSMIDKLKRETGKPTARPVPLRPAPFQIWTTSAHAGNRRGEIITTVPVAVPVMIISAGNGDKSFDNIIRVIPVSNDIAFHLEGETVAIERDSPLGYPFLLEIFNESPMLAGNLAEYRGTVSKAWSEKIRSVRSRYLDGPDIRPDKAYLAWKQRERELTRYLVLPVNESIWRDGASDREGIATQEADIFLASYRKAADAQGVDLSQIKPHILMDDDAFTLAVVQKVDRVLLRFSSDTLIPNISVDGAPVNMVPKARGLFEAEIGHSEQMPETMVVSLTMEGRRRDFHLSFHRGHDT